jgi:hypothetical protein
MSFTSRHLRGQFHTFTGSPLVHTSNPDFQRWCLWLRLPLTYETSFTSELRLLKPPKVRKIMTSRIRQILVARSSQVHDFLNSPDSSRPEIGKRPVILMPIRQFISCLVSGSVKLTVAKHLQERFPTTKDLVTHSRRYSRIRQLWRFEGERFLPNSPTLAPRGRGLTPTIHFHE